MPLPEIFVAWPLEEGFFYVEREVNIGWQALKRSLWRGKSRNFGKIFRKTFNLHSGGTLTI
jgi:hypothetical protein